MKVRIVLFLSVIAVFISSFFTNTVTPAMASSPTDTPTPTATLIGGIKHPDSSMYSCATAPQIFPFQTTFAYLPPIPSQPHWFKINVSKRGTYQVTVAPFNNQKFVNLDVHIFADCPETTPVATVSSATYFSPSYVHTATTEDTTNSTFLYIKIINSIGADFTGYGYMVSMNFLPNPPGLIDAMEDNQSQNSSRPIGYNTTIENLTIFNPSYAVDYDTFNVVIGQGVDFYCQATSSNTLLNLGIYPFLEGKEHLPFPQSVEGVRVELYNNYTRQNPRIVVHSILPGQNLYLRVYPENTDPLYLQNVGNITYKLECHGGLGEAGGDDGNNSPRKTPTPTPFYNSGSGASASSTRTATPTVTPGVVRFEGVLNEELLPTPPVPSITFSRVYFLVYYDLNGNGAFDPGEGVNNLVINILSRNSAARELQIRTDENGSAAAVLAGSGALYNYQIPLLALTRSLSSNDNRIVIAIPPVQLPAAIP